MSGGGAPTPGCLWESRAAEYLERHGIRVIARGYRCRLGELDIVGSDGQGLIVVEVRARRRTRHGSALETIGHSKRQRILRATRHFLMRHPEWHTRPIRFDVIAIDNIDSDEPDLAWVRNAFDSA